MSESSVLSAFPNAVKNADLVDKVVSSLSGFGYGSTTLLATSLCCDEINRELEEEFSIRYGGNFSMGGLAGFPFGGITSFGAMAAHIPDGGSCLVVYGPHVGVDTDGTVGTVNRRGRKSGGACCGSATAAAAFVSDVHKGQCVPASSAPPKDCTDAQQAFVGSLLLPHADRLANATNPEVELPYALFDAQTQLMDKIVSAACDQVAGKGKIALLGGIQINTPVGSSDYFLPLRFEILDNHGDKVADMMKLVDFQDASVPSSRGYAASRGRVAPAEDPSITSRATTQELLIKAATVVCLVGALVSGGGGRSN